METLTTSNSRSIDKARPSEFDLTQPCVQPICPPNPLQIWFSECVDEALSLVERRSMAFRNGDGSALNAQDERDRVKRYSLIEAVLQSPTTLAKVSGRELLQDIISGYLHEFSRQTLLGVPPLNIANPDKPQPVAKAFWESRPPMHFERQRFPGVHHTALAYHQLLREHFQRNDHHGAMTGRKAAWDATSELLRVSIDVFRARGREVFPDREIRASIYNDHLYVISHARRTFCADMDGSRRAA